MSAVQYNRDNRLIVGVTIFGSQTFKVFKDGKEDSICGESSQKVAKNEKEVLTREDASRINQEN